MLVGIEQLFLSPHRDDKRLPRVPIGLTRQMNDCGQVDPVIVRTAEGNRFEILSNAETWLAVQRAGLHQVDVFVRDDLDENEAIMIINGEFSDDPLAEAEWFESQLKGQGGPYASITALAKAVGFSRSYVSHSIRLLDLDDAIKAGIRVGALDIGHAKKLLSVKNRNRRLELAKYVVHRKWSVRDLSNAIKGAESKNRKNKSGAEEKSVDVLSLERDLSGLIGSPVDIDHGSGKMTIDYGKNVDILDGIISKLGYRA